MTLDTRGLFITVTAHGRHCISTTQPVFQQLVHVNIKKHFKRWLKDSPYKGLVLRKEFPCCNVIIHWENLPLYSSHITRPAFGQFVYHRKGCEHRSMVSEMMVSPDPVIQCLANRREVGTRFASLIFANMRPANMRLSLIFEYEAKPHIRWPHIREYEAGESGANFTSVSCNSTFTVGTHRTNNSSWFPLAKG